MVLTRSVKAKALTCTGCETGLRRERGVNDVALKRTTTLGREGRVKRPLLVARSV